MADIMCESGVIVACNWTKEQTNHCSALPVCMLFKLKQRFSCEYLRLAGSV